jgi:hypothetical protein
VEDLEDFQVRSFVLNDFLHAFDELNGLSAPLQESGYIVMGTPMEPPRTQE